MEVSRVTSDRLTEEHLNAHYYAPRFLRNEEILAQSGLPHQAIEAIAIKCNCGATPKNVEYDGHGQGLIRTTDVRPNLFLESGVLRTKALSVLREGATAAVTEDIVYTMSGTLRFAAVIPETDEVFSFSNTIARARLRKEGKYDPRFVAAFFNSQYGYTQSIRLVSGGVQGHVMPNPFKRLRVAIPDTQVQKYIGDKVRQAERLRRLAWHESNLADAIVAGLMEQSITEADVLHRLIDNPGGERRDYAFEEEILKRYATTRRPDSNSRKHSSVSISFLGDRLDARHYEQRFLDLKTRLREINAVSLRNVIDKVECGPFGGNAIVDELYEADGLPFLRPINLSGNRFDSSGLVRVSENRLRSQGLKIYSGENLYFARVGTPCVVMLRARASISPNVIVAQGNADAADVGYLYCFSKSHFGMMQLEQEIKEGVQPTTSTDAVRNLQVVLPDKRIQKYVGDKCRRSEELFDLSIRLTTAASALVDALIEGEVTESTLSSAEAARDRGDYMLDREVLSGLIENRTDATRACPLFPDLDALYAAIDEAERAHTDRNIMTGELVAVRHALQEDSRDLD